MASKLKRFNQNNKKLKLKFDCLNNIYKCRKLNFIIIIFVQLLFL